MKFGSIIPWRAKQKGQADREQGWLSPVNEFHTEVDRLFDRFFQDEWTMPAMPTGWTGWAPSLDVAETDDHVTVRAEIPGVDPNELDISVTGDALTIAGQKKEESERNENGYYHSECRYGSFRRTVPLPKGVDSESVVAAYKDGVLTIEMKKTPDATAKRIDVKTS